MRWADPRIAFESGWADPRIAFECIPNLNPIGAGCAGRVSFWRSADQPCTVWFSFPLQCLVFPLIFPFPVKLVQVFWGRSETLSNQNQSEGLDVLAQVHSVRINFPDAWMRCLWHGDDQGM